MTDYWCDSCESPVPRYRVEDGECESCGSEVDEEWPRWPRAKRQMKTAVGAAILLAFVAGPPAWALYKLFTADVLYASETVTVTDTVTKQSGALPEVAPVVGVWLMVMMIVWMAAQAPIGRRF